MTAAIAIYGMCTGEAGKEVVEERREGDVKGLVRGARF